MIEICEICKIKKVDEQFFWGVDGNRPATNEDVELKVCKYAKAKNRDMNLCLNPLNKGFVHKETEL